MRISFFEEYPTAENFDKLKLIEFETTIYLAAKSLEEFYRYISPYKDKDHLRFAYWPILPESYWISPFSCRYELEKLVDELINRGSIRESLCVLLDLELPILNRKLFFKNLFSFFKNKRTIRGIFSAGENLNLSIVTAEYPVSTSFMRYVNEVLGISYPLKRLNHRKIVMLYTSMLREKKIERVKNYISKVPSPVKKNLSIGLGTIATGALGDEPLLSPSSLDDDLRFLEQNGIEECVIFRLGGLNRGYIRVIEKYL